MTNAGAKYPEYKQELSCFLLSGDKAKSKAYAGSLRRHTEICGETYEN